MVGRVVNNGFQASHSAGSGRTGAPSHASLGRGGASSVVSGKVFDLLGTYSWRGRRYASTSEWVFIIS